MPTSFLSCAHECAAYRGIQIKEGGRGYHLGIVALGTTLSGTRRQAGRPESCVGTVGGGGGREALAPFGRTNLLEQTKCQSLLAQAAGRKKIYNNVTCKICSMVFDIINGCQMNQS